MSFAIRKVLPEDAREYIACHIACWQAAYKGLMPDDYLAGMSDSLDERTERFLGELENPAFTFYCATENDSIIGRLIIGPSRDEDKPGAGEIGALYLLPDYWGCGYGRRMMDFAVDALKQAGYGELIVWTLIENKRGRRFYESYGFTHDGSTREYNLGKPLMGLRYVL